MSRAFVKENDLEHAGIDIPERPVSLEKNYVTEIGLSQIKENIETLHNERQKITAKDDTISKQMKMRIERDIRYFTTRLKSAIVIKNENQSSDSVLFGAKVELENEDDTKEYFKIVGEDEADLKLRKISYVSPIAKSIIGSKVDDEVVLSKPDGFEILIIKKITYK